MPRCNFTAEQSNIQARQFRASHSFSIHPSFRPSAAVSAHHAAVCVRMRVCAVEKAEINTSPMLWAPHSWN